MSSIKLTYFNIRGRGELIRLILHASGTKFEDKRIEFAEWPQLKPQIPFGQLPLVEIDGVTVNQSVAIAEYFAIKHGLAGDSDLDRLRSHAYVQTLRDMGVPIVQKLMGEKDSAKQAELIKTVVEPEAKKMLAIFEAELGKCPKKSGHLVGGKLNYADLELFGNLTFIVHFLGKDILKDYPLQSKLYETVSQHPKLKAYLESRPKTPF